MKLILLTVLSSLLLFSSPAFSQEKPLQLRAAIHLSSVVSEGNYDLPNIAALARHNGIAVVAVTDRDSMKWEYGFWPLRNIIKKAVWQHSLFTYGIKRYLNYLEEIQSKFPDLILIPGVESAPHYYWQGSPVESASLEQQEASGKGLKDLRRKVNQQKGAGRTSSRSKNLKMYNWHRHLVTLGLEKYADYRNLPVVGNPRGLRRSFNPFALWPVVLLVFAVWLWLLKVKIYKAQKIIAALIAALGLLFFWNNWPFFKLKFDQYHDSGVRPYQNYIDYVNARGGLVFWAHPEAAYKLHMVGIDFITPEHSATLAQTQGYAGFCIFPEGSRQVGRPKGLWDELLLEYCRGVRKTPVWAIAGLSFEKGDLSQAMKNRQTVIITSERSRRAVVDALRNGKMYALEGHRSADFSLDEFYVTDEGGLVKAGSGETAKVKDNPRLHISGRFTKRQTRVEIRVIRNGSIFKRYILETPFNIVCADKHTPDANVKSYYRLEIVSKGLHLVSNPIFVEGK
jgi:hypothetical protein